MLPQSFHALPLNSTAKRCLFVRASNQIFEQAIALSTVAFILVDFKQMLDFAICFIKNYRKLHQPSEGAGR